MVWCIIWRTWHRGRDRSVNAGLCAAGRSHVSRAARKHTRHLHTPRAVGRPAAHKILVLGLVVVSYAVTTERAASRSASVLGLSVVSPASPPARTDRASRRRSAMNDLSNRRYTEQVRARAHLAATRRALFLSAADAPFAAAHFSRPARGSSIRRRTSGARGGRTASSSRSSTRTATISLSSRS